MYSIFAANSKEEVDGYVTTGVTSIPRHFASIMRPFFLDVGRMPGNSRVSIQFHMVSYCSAIKWESRKQLTVRWVTTGKTKSIPCAIDHQPPELKVGKAESGDPSLELNPKH